ncbi:L-ascorbate metabolism protein UlaG, beta-lactamase superfamily [Franzmannia pantelleriensis]|uniref:L-ascorbate metabolism protein UlaG, beta-lactamase superfamily n=1 Tax=Franzmannia pantelleriensis TaxID=48727 RepID=A0A1G9R7Y9_9GAMM|nr:MBL fold metallo-hydrolase [Halomonas pantelleriensis]SDM19344.1 L-ascorbate metabolism protein UlaG, beta-lactamase superfamily [Halomonas pantelleriensis]
MKKWLRRTALVLLVLGAALAAGSYAYLQHPKFGALPEGESLRAIEASPHYVDGEFRNLIDTPMRTGESRGFVGNVMSMLFDRNPRLAPDMALPSVRRDLKALDPEEDVVVWLGHSSYFVQVAGHRILIDPVFSTEAAPAPYLNTAFAGTTPYTADDFPEIDYLLITHDHWDHLDYPSIAALRERVRHVVTGLGMGEYFRHWDYPAENIYEADWNSVLELDPDLRIHVLPARHYSGRMLTRNKTLWVAFALEAPQRNLYFSGDSGYGPHFREIGERLGGFDVAALDMGQYDSRWANIHMTPEEAAQAALDLDTQILLPGHAGRFSIAAHDWDEPFERIVKASEDQPYRLVVPIIGEVIRPDDEFQEFSRWWATDSE